MKKELTNKQIFEIYLAIEAFPKSSIEIDVKTHILLAFIKKNCEVTYNGIKNASKHSKEYIEYIKELKNIASKFSKKDEKGKPIYKIEGSNTFYDIPEEAQQTFLECKGFLEKNNKEIIEKEEKRKEDLKLLLEEKQEIEIKPIKSSD